MMPLFGEIVEPVSRALYIDDDSDDETASESTMKIEKIEWIDDVPASIEALLIFHGQLATDFLLKVLQGVNSKSAIHLKETLFHQGRKAPSKSNIFMYRLSKGIFGCLCPTVDITCTSSVSDKLEPVLNICRKVIVLATVPAPFYKGNDPTLDLPPSFMRVLYSSTCDSKDTTIAPLLESPNMATGVPAAILNWCEVFKKPGCLYMCYSDSHHLDSIAAEPLVNVFSHVFEGHFESKILSFQSAVHEPTSNLYM